MKANDQEYQAQTLSSWLASQLGAKELLFVLLWAFSVGGTWFTMQAKIDDLNHRATAVEERLNRDMVPRAEEMSRDTLLNQRLTGIETTLRDIQLRLMNQQQLIR